MRTVTVTVTEAQARTVIDALDLYMRVGLGQWAEVARGLDWGGDYPTRDTVEDTLRALSGLWTHLGGHASYGIMSPEVADDRRIAGDIRSAIRNALHHPCEGCSLVDHDLHLLDASTSNVEVEVTP